MAPYLLLAALIALPAVLHFPANRFLVQSALFFIILALFIGLRHNVGMDWNNYLRMIAEAGSLRDYADILQVSEPLYALLLMAGDTSGMGIYIVNLVATISLLAGLWSFLRLTPEPWLGLMVALPVFLLVVGMSANRQALASGLLMIAVANRYRWSNPTKTLFILFCTGFHASSLLFLAFVGMDLKVRPIFKVIGIGILAVLVFFVLNAIDRVDYYNAAYGEGRSEVTQSAGALIHASLNALPAALYFLLPRFRTQLFPNSILRNLAFAALAIVPMTFISSAAAGRVSLYFFPVSIWVLSSLPSIVNAKYAKILRLLICGAMIFELFFYLSYGNSAKAHIPYQNALFVDPWDLQIGYVP